MITTRDIKVDLNLGKRPLKQVTTKSVDVYVKPGKPEPTKIAVSTHTIEDVADIAEKARRDKIAAQKKEQNEIIASLEGESIDGKPSIDSTKYSEKKEKKLTTGKKVVKKKKK